MKRRHYVIGFGVIALLIVLFVWLGVSPPHFFITPVMNDESEVYGDFNNTGRHAGMRLFGSFITVTNLREGGGFVVASAPGGRTRTCDVGYFTFNEWSIHYLSPEACHIEPASQPPA
jgi:hypothetical protein